MLVKKLTIMPAPIKKPNRTSVRNSETHSSRNPIVTIIAVKNRARPVNANVLRKTSAGSAVGSLGQGDLVDLESANWPQGSTE